MRNYCIETNIRQIFGIMTNFHEWIFTYYDLLSEGTKILENLEVLGDHHINPFEMSKVYRVVKGNQIDEKELFKVIKMI
jgi:hypothetical protein